MKNQLFNGKILFSFLAVVMCLGFTAMSYGQAVVSVEPAEIESPAAGEQLTVSINVTGGAGVSGYQMTVNFDPTALNYIASVNADYLPPGAFPTPPSTTDSSVGIAAASLSGPAPDGDGTLATVTFEVIEAKASTISLTGVILATAGGGELEVTTADGMVTVAAAETAADTAAEGTAAIPAETAAEAPAEGTEETPAETAADTAVEGTEETPAETAADTAAEGTEETPAETAVDTAVEGTEETPAETAADTAAEGTAETAADTAAEGTAETAADTAAEGTEETPAETAADTAVEGIEETTAEVTEPEMPVSQMFEITLTNLTTGEPGMGGQILSPPIFVTHAAGINLAPVGKAATPALVALAENGDASGLATLAAGAGAKSIVAEGPVIPGGSVTVTVTADMTNSSLSVGSMLVSTNDAFIAVTDAALFDEAGMPVSATLDLMAYDAGSEDNTELASDIPGPLGLAADADPEGSNKRVPTEGGVITLHKGIQGVGDVTEAFAWHEPTAMLTITPVEAPAGPVVEEPVVEEPVVEEPVVEVPVVEAPVVSEVPSFDITLEPGLNMISIPLMPEKPYTAKSLAEMLSATVVIQLDAGMQRFVGYTVADTDEGFGIEGGSGYIVNTPAGGMVKFTGKAWTNQPEPEESVAEVPAGVPVVEEEVLPAVVEVKVPPAVVEVKVPPASEIIEVESPAAAEEVVAAEAPVEGKVESPAAAEEVVAAEAPVEGKVESPAAAEEVVAAEAPVEGKVEAPAAPALSTYKSAWAFVVTSNISGMETGTAYTLVAENLRTGVIATEKVTSTAKRSSAVWADLNRKSVVEAGDKLEVALYDERGTIISGPFQRTVSTVDIRNAFLSLQLTVGDVRPKETLLAQNFPNPFNPETWIPYQLNKATEVTLHIFDVSGRLVRTLDLGWQAPGSYMTPSSAAYWDGRNAVGERVSSGIYFYTLQTSDFAATRRMVILK